MPPSSWIMQAVLAFSLGVSQYSPSPTISGFSGVPKDCAMVIDRGIGNQLYLTCRVCTAVVTDMIKVSSFLESDAQSNACDLPELMLVSDGTFPY